MAGSHNFNAIRSPAVVSVIIPAYNAEVFIAETLASAQVQTYPHLDIIVVDDGSTDRTAEVVETVARRDKRVRLLHQSHHGVAAARNLGIRESRGAFIATLDADDLWHSEKIAKQLASMCEGGPNVGMVYAWSSTIDEAGRILPRRGYVALYEGNISPFLVVNNFVGNGSVPLLRRHCVLEVGGYDTTLRSRRGEGSEDLLLYHAVAERYEVALVPAFLVGYRTHAFNMSNNIRQMKRGHTLALQIIRAQHPLLASRVFRWSEALKSFYLSIRSLHSGKPLLAFLLFARAIAYDPCLLVEPPFRRAVRRFTQKLLNGPGSIDHGENVGLAFLDSCTRPDGTIGLERTFLGQRRHAFLMSLANSTRRSSPAMKQPF